MDHSNAEEVRNRKYHEFWSAICFMAMGVGYLFPFSALTQPVDYWSLLFPDFDIEFEITVVYMYVNLIVLGYFVFFADSNVNYSFRLNIGFFGQFLALAIVPTSYFWHMNEHDNYWTILFATAFAAGVTALIDSCIISLAAQYNLASQEGLQIGIGLSTLIGSVYRCFTKLAFPANMTVQSSLLYFYTGAVTVLGCMIAYYVLMNLGMKTNSESDENLYSKVNTLSTIEEETDSLTTSTTTNTANNNLPKKNDDDNDDDNKANGEKNRTYGSLDIESVKTGVEGHHIQVNETSRMKVFSNVLHNQLVVFSLFTSTLALWPPLVAEIPSFNFPILNEEKWWPLILLFDFSLLDVIGRFMVGYRGCLTKDNIWLAVTARFIISFPLIICLVKSYLFTHDFWSILFVGALGYTNGYLGSLSIIFVSEKAEVQDRGLTGTLTGFVLNAGLVAGATIAIFVQEFVHGL